MAKAKTAGAAANTLIIAAIFLAALPCLTAQSPSPTAMPPMSGMAPEPFPMAPSPGLDCFTYLVNLSDCLTFVEAGSNLTKPDPGCCPELANLVNTQPICLCQLLGNPSQIGIAVDMHKALRLPSVCNVTTPPVSLCAAIGVPVAALSPSGLSPTGGPSAADGSVSASPSPGTEGPGNGSPSNLASNQLFLIGLALVLFTYFF